MFFSSLALTLKTNELGSRRPPVLPLTLPKSSTKQPPDATHQTAESNVSSVIITGHEQESGSEHRRSHLHLRVVSLTLGTFSLCTFYNLMYCFNPVQ